MADKSKIQWCDATWPIVAGCEKIGEGCKNCYAIPTCHRLAGNPNPKVSSVFQGLVDGGRWTGTVRFVPERLDWPLKWRKSRRIFVSSLGDLFHVAVNGVRILRVLDVIVDCPQHRFIILTKRPARMWKFLVNIDAHVARNAIFGASASNQAEVNAAIWDLNTLNIRGWHTCLSLEPLLGPVTFAPELLRSAVDWVIVGGESGPNARPMHPDWVRSIRDQCQAASVPFFFKPWGEWVPYENGEPPFLYAQNGKSVDGHVLPDFESDDPRGPWLIDDEMCVYKRVGKRVAGRLLDGREHSALPAAMLTDSERSDGCRRPTEVSHGKL